MEMKSLSQAGRILKPLSPSLAVLIRDPGVPVRFSRQVLASLTKAGIRSASLTLSGGEKAKNLSELERLARACACLSLGRDGVLISLGGGVCSDLTGFLASTWMRGIPWLAIPTTLLALADAALGGKTAVDLPEGKNLLGAFHPPLALLCDLDTLASLPQRRYVEGLAEILKCAVLTSPKALAWIEQDASALTRRNRVALRRALGMAQALKLGLVARDPRETRGLRERLNLGHTLAHAAETASGWSVSHGQAVAAGLVAEAELAKALGLSTDPSLPGRLKALMPRLGLPVSFPRLNRVRFLQALGRDKKALRGRIRVVLPVRPGKVITREVPLAALALVL